MPQRPLQFLFLLVFSLILFSAHIRSFDLVPPDEPRFAEVAREMVLRGDYLSPHMNGEPYNEKPPLLFWAMIAASAPSFEVDEFTARIPSLLSGVVVVALTYLLTARMFGPGMAFWAAIILMTGYRFWWQTRVGQIDMLLTACLTVSLYALWRWEEERRKGWLLLIYGGLSLGMLAKGPPALVFVLLFILVFYWGNKAARRELHWVIGTLVAIAITAAWFIPARMAVADTAEQAVQSGMAQNLFRNTLGRLVMGVSKAQWPWYYLQTIPTDILPWTLFLPWTLVWVWKNRRENKPMWFLWCWTVPALIFFSISVGKRAIYILPLFPVFAIFLAGGVQYFLDTARPAWRTGITIFWGGFLVLLGSSAAVLPFTEYADALTLGVKGFAVACVLLGLTALAAAFRMHKAHATPEGTASTARWLPAMVAGQMALLLFLAAWTVFPVVNEHKSARKFCAPVRQLAEAGEDFRLYSVGFSREEYVYYSRHFHEAIFTSLLGADDLSGDISELYEVAAQQKKARKIIAGAVEDFPVADIGAITPQERTQLIASIESAIDAMGDEAEEVRAFEHLIQDELDAFAATFTEGSPAFMFVQAEDWLWLMPLYSDPPVYDVVHHRNVGSREVLLLANPAGAALLAQRGAV